ncbi:hypothetical protein KR009_011633 [Drosophila setifemur]|nr:hypothetical protein KR009_011633 [Drosophila setifemur]
MRYGLVLWAQKLLNSNKNSKFLVTYVRSLCSTIQINDVSVQAQHPQLVDSYRTSDKRSQDQRSLHIAVIGVPNVGKSTFINNIVNHRVCPTSAKVHTTRQLNTAICTMGQTQLVFYDTPGLITQREIRKHHLEQSFKTSYRRAIQHADVVAVVHDVSNNWTRKGLPSTVLDTLKGCTYLPSVLILNKIDALKSKRVLLDVIKILTNDMLMGTRGVKNAAHALTAADTVWTCLNKRESNWSHFSDVFLVSSITGSGMHELQEYLVGEAKTRHWSFPSDVHTDSSPEALIEESVRARLLDYLPQEIPYNLNCELEYYSVEKHVVYTSVQVQCPTPRIERLICGQSNGKLRQITERVTSDLVEMFGQAVSLTISTATKETKTSSGNEN